MKNRVVITGMGAITPIGNTVDEFWENAKCGKLGIDTFQSLNIDEVGIEVSAEIKNLDTTKFLDKKECRRLDKFTQYALIASMEAVENAKLDLEKIDKNRFSVIVGSGVGGFNTQEKEFSALHKKGPKRVATLYIPMMIINATAANIAIKFGAKGMCTSVVTACATGTNNIGDAYHITSPHSDGICAAKAIEDVIKEAKIDKTDISYINAHGISTYYNDLYETRAIKNVFEDYAKNIPISSTKSMIGHLLGAAGAVESIACVKSLQDDFIHPTIGYTQSEEELDLDYVPNKGRKESLKYVLNNSLGFGGHNACLIFKKWE